MRLAYLFASFVASGALAAACNPYDPDLGNRPFRCGTEAPECPSGYQCVEYSASERFCEPENGGGPDDPDAGDGPDTGNFTCNDDSDIEPNDDIAEAFTTPIPDFATCTRMVQLAICPDSDKDVYRFRVEQNGKNMRATITTNVDQGQLVLQVLNGSGATIANGVPVSGTEIEVAVANLAVGTYFVRVGSPDGSGIRNNYQVEINTCDTAGCPSACP